MADRDCSSGALLGAFLLGGMVGAAIALLTAPRPGRETREKIGEWADGAREKTREKVHQFAQEAGERVRTYGRETADRIKEVTHSAREKLRRGGGAAGDEGEGEGAGLPDQA
ncbi:MAG: hypothetical protein Kow0062_20030 [Acidobacteriota bacterium]|nr:MAG: YtxH domain-containing protein [Acidobacteriota bacterium]